MTPDARVRAVIVEDEPLVRALLREYTEPLEWLEVVGEAVNGPAAVRLIDELRPDLVFLDVHLPELSGLDVLERAKHEPAVIFTTAHDEYAVPAFELEALDYLLKPFALPRFLSAVERARVRLAARHDLPPVRERARSAMEAAPLERVFLQVGDRIVPVPTGDVTRFEAAGDYVRIHVGGRRHLASLTLTELESRLDPRRFLRVHRSHVVNVDRIVWMERHDDRRLLVHMDDGSEVLASRTGSRRLRNLAT